MKNDLKDSKDIFPLLLGKSVIHTHKDSFSVLLFENNCKGVDIFSILAYDIYASRIKEGEK